MQDADSFFDAAVRLLDDGPAARRFRWSRPGAVPFPDDPWRMAASQGWFRILVPENNGGLGLGLPEIGAIFRAVGQCLLRGPMLDQAVAVPLLLPYASGHAHVRLEAALDGEAVVALVEELPPPHGRSDQTLRIVDDRIVGRAELVPFAQHATDFIVSVRHAGQPCLLILPAALAHVLARDSLDPCVDYAQVVFDHVPVGQVTMLAKGEPAQALLRRIHDTQRLLAAAELGGCAQALTNMAVEHVKNRSQFGRPIGSFQALQHMLATMAVRTAALGNLVTCALQDAQAEPARSGELGVLAKAYADQVGHFVALECLQAHGAIGFAEEIPLHLYLRRVLTYRSFRGDSDSLLRALGANVIGAGDAAMD